ncbi:hydroquinone glucosyltransferase-like [Magnolia sinica]|uniref:hydroquinone glucosyltransferase-like n=1 Tax=Magnolia sinica TaxID=86752 RepID=UPI00265A4660|nr:hydroquinone glucosyltransferase-like [Magnolia sinica]
MEDSEIPHVAILPSPGMGHLIPLAELAKRLAHHYNFSLTFITLTIGATSKTQNSILDTLPKTVKSIVIDPPPSVENIPEDAKVETRICANFNRSIQSIRNVLKNLASTTRLVAIIVDLFGMDALDVAAEVGVPTYIFYTSTCMALSFTLHLPTLDATYSCAYSDLAEPVKLPGCVPFHGENVFEPALDRSNDAYTWLLKVCRSHKKAKGILVNSFVDLEPETVNALRREPGVPPLYPIGPVVQSSSAGGGDGLDCLRWLDEQPRGSVLYVCFGSGGTLSMEQLNELALGLEMSGQRFLWVARGPHEKNASATFFSVQSNQEPLGFLPKGFLSRTKGVGFVVPSWAPQIQVLGHGSTGGFLSHCGWNSTLESIVHGVPMIAWPLYAEQKMNAVLLVEDLKVALRPTAKVDGIVEKEEIARVVEDLMAGDEGKRLRTKMEDLKDASAKALAKDGSSKKALSEVAYEWGLM